MANIAGAPHTAQLHAIALAEQGFRVFPVRPGDKLPLKKGWQSAATNDPIAAAREFDGLGANIGIATGAGLVVIDVDCKSDKPGLQSLHDLQTEFGRLPQTRIARTPTGGLHLYFRYDPAVFSAGLRVNARPGIDSRGDGGYVVAPPSLTQNGEYSWTDERPIAQAPEWLMRLLAPKPTNETPASRKGDFFSDSDPVILEALRFLHLAEPAVEGAGGDHHTFTIAARLRDMGITRETALLLLETAFNPRCSPPWESDELATKVANAYAYATNAAGAHAPDAVFAEDETAQRAREAMRVKANLRAEEAFKALRPKPITQFAPESLPARQWALDRLAILGKLTVLISPGGVGKSTWSILAAAAVATGREDLLAAKPFPHLDQKPHAAWIFNNEDDEEELLRRTYAMMSLHNIKPEDMADGHGKPRLYLNSGEQRPLMIAHKAKAGDASIIVPKDANAVAAHLVANDIKLWVVDPFVETHGADENDNVEINAVARIYRQIAQMAQCAIILVHHTRKHPAASADTAIGDADSGRGAGALMNAARVGLTLYSMTADDAKKLGVGESERWKYVRLDDAKANLTVRRTGLDAANWFERVSVELPAAGGVVEHVGALRPWQWAASLGSPDAQGRGDDLFDLAVALALDGLGGAALVGDVAESLRAREQFADKSADALRKKIERKYYIPVILEDGRSIGFRRDKNTDYPTGKTRGGRALTLEIREFALFG